MTQAASINNLAVLYRTLWLNGPADLESIIWTNYAGAITVNVQYSECYLFSTILVSYVPVFHAVEYQAIFLCPLGHDSCSLYCQKVSPHLEPSRERRFSHKV